MGWGAREVRSASARRRLRFVGVALAAVAAASAASCKAPPQGISAESTAFEPEGVAWNGVKVYLSSPRHASSGSRGECGWEENVNGRIFNLYAAGLNDAPGVSTLAERGYEVRVSPNTADDGWRLNRDESDNWGANVHLVTHTNANNGCGDSAQYLLVMFRTGDANSTGLRDRLVADLDPLVPGGNNSWNCDTLGECAAKAPHVAYIELFFHTNQAAVDWFEGPGDDPEATGAMDASPALGLAVDEHLGSPRAVTSAVSTLDAYPGFGRSPGAALRDETIAYWEAFRREQLVARCMNTAGFDYTPAVAFPLEDTRQVAENLGFEPSSTEVSPPARNRGYEAGLSVGERERYNQTLLGESAADVAEADRTGAVPEGRRAEDFATGGCVGAARDTIPSIWDAPRQLDAELDTVTTARSASAEVGAADSFVDHQARRLAAVAARYDGVMDKIAHDDALATYLRGRL